jgi:hypothetical protein
MPTRVIDQIAGEIIVTTEPIMNEFKIIEHPKIITAECVFIVKNSPDVRSLHPQPQRSIYFDSRACYH